MTNADKVIRPRPSRLANIAAWGLQVLLAALFLFAGVSRFVMPVEQMTQSSGLPGTFFHFIGGAEVLGALGLILPGLLRIKRSLTALAAAGLMIVMIGAVVMTVRTGPASMAVLPAVVAGLLMIVAVKRALLHSEARRAGSASLSAGRRLSAYNSAAQLL